MPEIKCASCAAPLETGEGVELWGNVYCSTCFITQAGELHRDMTPEALAAIRRLGRDLAGILPSGLVRMVLIGFYQRTTGNTGQPTDEELERATGEFQRLTYFAMARKVMSLLGTWKESFDEFVEAHEREMRETIKRLTELDTDAG